MAMADGLSVNHDWQELATTRTPIKQPRKRLKGDHDVAQLGFGGCAGMHHYFLGIAAALQDEYDLDGVLFSGASMGCIPSLLLALGMDVRSFHDNVNLPLMEEACQQHAKPGARIGRYKSMTRERFLGALPPDAFKRAAGLLSVSLTNVSTWQNELVDYWDSNEDLVDCILASAHIPVYCNSLTANYRGRRYIDGVVTNNSPVKHPHYPSKIFQIWTWRWVRPSWLPVSLDVSWGKQLFDMGYDDARQHRYEIEAAFAHRHL